MNWIAFTVTAPPNVGFYWLLSEQRQTILAHLGDDDVWRGVNAGGESFRLGDPYTHWQFVGQPTSQVSEP
jgi:hypothetical protein